MMVSLKMMIWMTLLTGIIYPLMMTTTAQLTMPQKANGSMIYQDEKVVGSELIGQKFSSAKYFWSRPSSSDYQALPGVASNLGPTSAELKKIVDARKSLLGGSEVPADLLFASASGLDPHITPEAAYFQMTRVAKERTISRARLEELIKSHIQKPHFYFLGVPRINVLELNLSLDHMEKSAS